MFPAKRLLDFINQEADYPRTRLIVFAILSGFANGLLLVVINHGISLIGNFSIAREIQVFYVSLFSICLTLFVYTKKYALEHAALLVEEVLCKVRTRIADKIRHTELPFVESTGHSYIYNCLSKDTIQISKTSIVIFTSIQAGIMVCFGLLYIAWLTPEGLLLTLSALTLGGWIFLSKRDGIIRDLNAATKHELRFFDSLSHTLSGFKEVKINRAKSRDLFSRQQQIATEVRQLKSQAGISSVFVMMFSEIFFYILIAVILFVWPYFQETDTIIIIKLTATVMFLMGPINLLFGSLPLFIEADLAVNNLRALEERINVVARSKQVGEPPIRPLIIFSEISFREVLFHYRDQTDATQFTVGPINLELRAGEVVFIVGGNGSGKSTLLKLLTGLYYPVQGNIWVNNEELDQDIYQDYRELFSVIFTDFHLFDSFYGIEDIDEAKVKAMLRKMNMENKTKFRDGAFTNVNLSTGQRKRLAYINAVLEDKQIYVFDELAADQDPQFRRTFYEVLLPELRNQGKTIIAVTHDDKYFNSADRLLKMVDGQLVEDPTK